MRPRVLLPIHLDRWTYAIASKLRECAIRMEDMDFYSFSSPQTEEDTELGRSLWRRPNLHRTTLPGIVTRPYDIVHHASATPANTTAILAAKLRTLGRTVQVFTASVELHKEEVYYNYFLLGLKMADRVLAVSEAVAQSVVATTGREVDGVIPNGVDAEYFAPQVAGPRPAFLKEERPYLLFAAAILQRKRPDVVLEIARRKPDLDFVLVGRPPLDDWGRGILSEIDRLDNVRYLGLIARDTVRDLMAHARLLLFPSDLEGMPNVVLEASAMGLPVLAQPRSSLPEIVENGVNGWLLPVEDLDDWCQRIDAVLDWTPKERSEYAGTARGYVLENFSWDDVASKLGMLYRQFLQDGPEG